MSVVLVDVASAASILGISKSAVLKAIARDALRATRQQYDDGGFDAYRYVIDVDEIERYRRESLGRRGPKPAAR